MKTTNQIAEEIISNGNAATNTELENEFEFAASEEGYSDDEIKAAIASPWFPKMKLAITVKNDDEGFFGNDPTDNLNVDASISNYENELKEALTKAFPTAEITLEYGSYAGASLVLSDDSIEEEVSEIVARVYERGTFWTEKNPAAVALGKLGGSKKSAAKTAAVQANGKKGGRPKKAK